MRLRHIQGAEETIATSPFVIQEPEQHRGHFHELFGMIIRSVLRLEWEKVSS